MDLQKDVLAAENGEGFTLPIMVEPEDLSKFNLIQITSVGDENMYFTHEEKRYYCKCL